MTFIFACMLMMDIHRMGNAQYEFDASLLFQKTHYTDCDLIYINSVFI